MSWLDFIARMTGSLAWPMVAVVVVLILRKPIITMLTTGPLKRIKAGPLEVEIDRGLAETEAALEASGASPPPMSEGSVQWELAVEVERAPAIAVLQAYTSLERELREIAQSLDLDLPGHASAVRMAQVLAKRQVISAATATAVESLSVLRNLVAHGREREVTKEQAAEYLALCDATLFAVRQNHRDSSR